jgi:hypothetical protein
MIGDFHVGCDVCTFMSCSSLQILYLNEQGMWHAWQLRERWENLKERDHWDDLDVYERIILKWILRTYDRTK